MVRRDRSRRMFLRNTGLAAAGFVIVPRHVLGRGFVAPSDTLHVAAIGAGGMGASDINNLSKSPHVKIVAMADVDERQAVKSRQAHPKAKFFRDFRVMLEKEGRHIDACSISTPDNTHAVATLAAMQLGKHVYTQKPLTHDIYEARVLTEAAKRYPVVTQMGNQGGSGEGVRRLQEIYQAGLIGEVHTVHAWTNRPVWSQGIPRPEGSHPVPPELSWDLWLGPAEEIAYHPAYLPFNWRGWWRFGTGALGDMACHIMDPIYRILPILYPSSVECSATDAWKGVFQELDTSESAPASSVVHLRYPRTDGEGEIRVSWYDGGIMPERPEELAEGEPFGSSDGGVLFIGTKGKLLADCYGANPRLLPSRRQAEEEPRVQQTLKRVPEGHWHQWVNACIAGHGKAATSSPFSFAGPFTESLLIANLALRSWQWKDPSAKNRATMYPGRKKLFWDAQAMRITNFEPANAFVRREYRQGWNLSL